MEKKNKIHIIFLHEYLLTTECIIVFFGLRYIINYILSVTNFRITEALLQQNKIFLAAQQQNILILS